MNIKSKKQIRDRMDSQLVRMLKKPSRRIREWKQLLLMGVLHWHCVNRNFILLQDNCSFTKKPLQWSLKY